MAEEAVRTRKVPKLHRGGDMHWVMVKVIDAGGHGDRWVNPVQACQAMMGAVRKPAIDRLISKGWIKEVGGMVQVTELGLKALEQI